MFSYQCEKCGMEVPPAYSECPNCKANAAQAAEAAAGVAQPLQSPPAGGQPTAYPQQGYPVQGYPPQQGYPPPYGYPPQQGYPPQPQGPPQQQGQPVYYTPAGIPPGSVPPAAPPPPMPPTVVGPPPPAPHAQQYHAPPPPAEQKRSGAPPWLVTLLVAVVFLLVGYLAYTQLLPKYRESQSATSLESPGAASEEAPVAGAPHKLNKHLELAGIRIVEEGRKAVVRLTVVNHSAAELNDIVGVVELHTTAEKSGSGPLGQIPLKLASLGAYEAKEVSLPFATKLRAYEMPDWQFVRAELKEGAR
jgi:hypothetical protein